MFEQRRTTSVCTDRQRWELDDSPGAPIWMCAAVGAWSIDTFKEYLIESIMKVSMHVPVAIEFIVCTAGDQ